MVGAGGGAGDELSLFMTTAFYKTKCSVRGASSLASCPTAHVIVLLPSYGALQGPIYVALATHLYYSHSSGPHTTGGYEMSRSSEQSCRLSIPYKPVEQSLRRASGAPNSGEVDSTLAVPFWRMNLAALSSREPGRLDAAGEDRLELEWHNDSLVATYESKEMTHI